MDDLPMHVTVRFQDHRYDAAVDPAERADQLLLRSLYHFGIDPEEKGDWHLKPRAADEREASQLVLDRPIGDQLTGGAELVLEVDVAGNRRLSTGSY